MGVVLLALILAGCGGEEAIQSPRNVILISIDTLRPDHLGCYGYDRETSPAIDSLAEAGVVFEDVTSAAPWTLPGHASMLTGLLPSTHGVKDHDNTLTTETLATRLAKEGFWNWALVNSHNLGDKRYGLLRGFDSARSHYVLELNRRAGTIDNHGDKITRRAIDWLKGRDDRPFFFFIHYYDTHTDLSPKPEYKRQFVAPYDGPMNGRTGQLLAYRKENKPLTEADVRWLKEMYDAEIRQLDDELAGLFAYLDESGLSDSTLVVITSDHGEEFYEHGSVLHGRTQYQELLAIPLILRGPGVPSGLRVDTPVHLVDVAPTVLSLLGVEPTLRMDGLDLSLFWKDSEALPKTRFLYGEADHNNIVDGERVIDIKKMIRIGPEKLLYDTASGQRELYDLRTDPGEQDDLSETAAPRADELLAELHRYIKKASDGTSIEGPDEETVEKLRALGYIED